MPLPIDRQRGKYCSLPTCKEQAAELSSIGGGEPLWLCTAHVAKAKAGEVPNSLLQSARDWLCGRSETYFEIQSRVDLLKYLVAQVKESDCINIRLNYVGPLIFHPQWYHDRRDELEYPAPNLERAIFACLLERSNTRYFDVKLISRNAQRYLMKVDNLVEPHERERFVEETLANVDRIWPDNGTYGPDLLCEETGFHRHIFIFPQTLTEVVRRKPELQTELAIVYTDLKYVDMQRSLFDQLYRTYKRNIITELATLKSFIKSVLTSSR